MLRLSSWMAIVVGALLAVGQIVRNAENVANWPTWVIDVAAGLVLVVAGYLGLRRGAERALAAAWAFPAGLFLSGFVNHFQAWRYADPEGVHHATAQQLAVVVAALLAICVAGVVMSLMARKPSA